MNSETSNKVLNSVSQVEELVPLLLIIIEIFTDLNLNLHKHSPSSSQIHIPPSLALVSAQCLYTLTEDDFKLIKFLTTPSEAKIRPLIHLFETPTQAGSVEENQEMDLLKVVTTGILRNLISQTKRPERLSFKAAYDLKMPDLLTRHLDLDLIQFAHQVVQANAAIVSLFWISWSVVSFSWFCLVCFAL